MNRVPGSPTFFFVWDPEAVSPAGLRIMGAAGGTVLVDGTYLDAQRIGRRLAEIGDPSPFLHVLVSARTLMDSSFRACLVEKPTAGIWTEIHPFLSDVELKDFVHLLKNPPANIKLFPILSDMGLIREWLAQGVHPPRLALKGSEASGFTSGDSLLLLYSGVCAELKDCHVESDLFIFGGVGTAEAAAALLCTGAAGVAFESLHWLTDMAGGPEEFRQQIGRLRPDHTQLIGQDIGVPCRLFNRGNSPAVKELQAMAASLAVQVADPGQKADFARHIQGLMIRPGQHRLSRQDVIPLGVEAAFAKGFVERHGQETEGAVKDFVLEVKKLMAQAGERKKTFLEGWFIREMGLDYPFVQGAMTWITDVVPFAVQVADAGALPTIALGLMDEKGLHEKLDGNLHSLEGRSYAVNLLALPENPFLEAQLSWIQNQKPPFVVIAAGSPHYIRQMREWGIEVLYVAPNEEMVRLALASGARHVICEGNEAGGHVGAYTTLTFAQRLVDLRRSQPALFENRGIILAGGIWNEDTVCMAALLGADAVQMGTAYLTTHEIVSSGALSECYQRMIIDSPQGGTAVTGEAWGLPVRSLLSPMIRSLQALEQSCVAGGRDRGALRGEVEALTAGSLLMAARGVNPRTGLSLTGDEYLAQGQFMSGACAGFIHRTNSLKDLHAGLAAGLFAETMETFQAGPPAPPAPECLFESKAMTCDGFQSAPSTRFVPVTGHHKEQPERIAITGMSITNALGNSPQEVWAASLAMRSGITFVPSSRWDHNLLYDPRPGTLEKSYCRVVAFKELTLSRKDLGISPHDFRTMSKSTRDTLHLARVAIEDSGILGSGIPPERISVLLSQNAGEFSGTLEDIVIRVSRYKLAACANRALSLNSEAMRALQGELIAGRRAIDDTTLVGRLNSAAVGFVCRQYGFMGPSHAVSAACATSLVALFNAVQMIRNGIIDAALVGGGEEDLSPVHFLEFSALGVLAGISGVDRPPEASCRPFDAARDGTVLGEGGGMLVIERESLALKRGARIYALLTGMGAANNHQGLVEPSCQTQTMAIRASLKDTGGYGPGEVDLVECHATATTMGDTEEMKSLVEVFGGQRRTLITSFKSQIGHTLGASAVNSLIRGVMAMRAGVFPPTLNCDDPGSELGNGRSGVMVSREPAAWPSQNGLPRRLQVNAFGFGGSNYVAQLEESTTERGVVLVDSMPVPPMALLFPGQGSQYRGMGKGLYNALPAFRQDLDNLSRQVDFDLRKFLFDTPEKEMRDTRLLQPALFCLEHTLAARMLSYGLKPVALAGHSLGEFTALCLAGVFSVSDGLRLVARRGQCMGGPASSGKDMGMMLAVNAPPEVLTACLKTHPRVFPSNINAPNQVVVAGESEEVRAFQKSLGERGFRGIFLKVGMAFHTPGMRTVRAEVEEFLATITFHPPRIPVISNLTGKPFPANPAEMKKMVVDHLESPVLWEQCVRYLWEDCGTRLFVECGPGDVLGGLISFTLPEAICLSTCTAADEPAAFRGALARLDSAGYPGTGSSEVWNDRPVRPKPARPESSLPRPTPEETEACPVGLMEDLIGIIMEATGYERDELDPDMDLKEELAIRSSRLPVIMMAAEDRFGISVQFEDFIGVRTIRQMAARVLELISMAQAGGPGPPSDLLTSGKVRVAGVQGDYAPPEIRRLAFEETSLEMGRFTTVELQPGQMAAVMGAGRPTTLCRNLQEVLRWDHGLNTVYYAFTKSVWDWAAKGFDLRLEDGARRMAESLRGLQPLAGLVILLEDSAARVAGGVDDAARLLEGFFLLIKAFLESGDRKFAFLIQPHSESSGFMEVVAEGILGMYLSLALEDREVQFRALRLDKDTDLGYAMRCALDRSRRVVETNSRMGEAFTRAGRFSPLAFRTPPECSLGPEDVVVLSGGGRGITAELALALAPFGPRMVLIGTTRLDPRVDYRSLLEQGGLEQAGWGEDPFVRFSSDRDRSSSAGNGKMKISHLKKGLEIARTLEALGKAGIDAVYQTCDVADIGQTTLLMEDMVRRFGRIDGIIHGAGLVRDGLMANLSVEDFRAVVKVKALGAWNLYHTAAAHGLRFFAALSSVAAALGGPAQANYAAANRALGALVSRIGQENPALRCQTLLLPPIAGTGMAEMPDVREIMRLRKMEGAYIQVEELREIFRRELLMGPGKAAPVLFMRMLPKVPVARLEKTDPHIEPRWMSSGGMVFEKEHFPLIDEIVRCDLGEGILEARRVFSTKRDLWLEDHKPFKSLRHPLISAVMALEALMEASRLLLPCLKVVGLRQARFLEMLECPAGLERPVIILCKRLDSGTPHATCQVSLSSEGVPPLAGLQGQKRLHFQSVVVLGGVPENPAKDKDAWEFSSAELDTPPVDETSVLDTYRKRSGFKDRYCVLKRVEGTGTNVIVGRTLSRQKQDFSAWPLAHYQYSPYMLEAIFHLVAAHKGLREEQAGPPMVPVAIESLLLGRKDEQGEDIRLEARMKERDEEGVLWDARVLDGTGTSIMEIRGLRMQKVSDETVAKGNPRTPDEAKAKEVAWERQIQIPNVPMTRVKS